MLKLGGDRIIDEETVADLLVPCFSLDTKTSFTQVHINTATSHRIDLSQAGLHPSRPPTGRTRHVACIFVDPMSTIVHLIVQRGCMFSLTW